MKKVDVDDDKTEEGILQVFCSQHSIRFVLFDTQSPALSIFKCHFFVWFIRNDADLKPEWAGFKPEILCFRISALSSFREDSRRHPDPSVWSDFLTLFQDRLKKRKKVCECWQKKTWKEVYSNQQTSNRSVAKL